MGLIQSRGQSNDNKHVITRKDDATFEIDSGAHISLVSKDFVSESDMLPGIHHYQGQSQTVPCAGLNVVINGVSKYYKLVVSDRIGSEMVILGCDIACDFKHEPVQVKLTRAQSKNLQADKTDRQPQESHDGASPNAFSNNTTELTVETNHSSNAISCASTFKPPSCTRYSFIFLNFIGKLCIL